MKPDMEAEDVTPVGSRPWKRTKTFMSSDVGNIIKSTRKFGVEIECIPPNEQSYYIVMNAFPEIGGGYDGGGREFKTPILAGQDGEEYIIKLGDLLTKKGYTLQHTCGMHLHIDGGKEFLEENTSIKDSPKTANLKRLLTFLIQFENVIQSFVPLSRRYKQWCAPLTWISTQQIQKCTTQFEIEKLWYTRESEYEIASAKTSTRGGPRPGFNFTPLFAENHIEIRYHSGTINPRKILEWVNLFTTIVDRSHTTGLFVDISRAPSLEERTQMFFDILSLSKSSREYFLARQQMFQAVSAVKLDMDKMKAVIMADSEILV